MSQTLQRKQGYHSKDAIELSKIDFSRRRSGNQPGSGTDEAYEYAAVLFVVCADLGGEVEGTAELIKRAIIRTTRTGHLDGAQASHTAKRTTKHLMQAAEDLSSAAIHARKFWDDYTRMYDNLIHPEAGSWDFETRDH